MKKHPIKFTVSLLSIFHVSPLFSACDYYRDLSNGDTISKMVQICGKPDSINRYWDDNIKAVVYLYMYNETDDMRGITSTWMVYTDKQGFIFKIEQKD